MRSLLLAIVLLLATACVPGERSTTSASVTLPACQVRLPADWGRALTDARVGPGEALAMGPDGEIIARHGREVVLTHSDKPVSTVYTIPDPRQENVRLAKLDRNWIVLGLYKPGTYVTEKNLKRIAVIDSGDGTMHTIAEVTDTDYEAVRNVVDSVAIFGDKVYWITLPSAKDDGTLRSYDLKTATTTDVQSGDMHDLRATATGLVWTSGSGERRRLVFLGLAPLPPALASIAGIADDQTSLVRDRDAYAWITGVADGGTGIARWSPENGLTRISTLKFNTADGPKPQPLLTLSGPYVVVDPGNIDISSKLVDTRTGALTLIDLNAIGSANDSIAYSIRDADGRPGAVGSLRTERLSPLTCTPTASGGDAAQKSCEVPTPRAWREAFSNAAVETRGPTEPLAVGPGGDVAARLVGDSGELLLIDGDAAVRSVYRITQPSLESVRFAAVDERWIVVGVGVNRPPPELTRIDVVDRSNDSVRTVMKRDLTKLRGYGDSLALFDGTVYWTSYDGANTTTMHSYDLDTKRTADVTTAKSIDGLQATPIGIAWTQDADSTRAVLHNVAELPAAVLSAGADPNRDAVATDGDAYAWLADAEVVHWSPSTGVKRINTNNRGSGVPGALEVVGPYVIGGFAHGSFDPTILDTRSGAITSVEAQIVATGGGTVALQIPADAHHSEQAGLVRLANLPPLTC